MKNEISRMQFLSGVITESEYKTKLQETLWDKIKNAPQQVMADLKGGVPATIASVLEDAGIKVGTPYYFSEYNKDYDKFVVNMFTLKKLNYNTGIGEIEIKTSPDGGKTFKLNNAESLNYTLTMGEDFSKLQNMTKEELEAWYNKQLENHKKYGSLSGKDGDNSLEGAKKQAETDNEERAKRTAPLNESMIGGIVGIGAINQIPSRAKADYETSFEHFLGGKYGLNEVEEVNENMYYHVLEDGGNGDIGHQGVYDTQEEAQNRADELTDMFPNSEFYVEASDSEDEPYSVTSSDYDPDKDFNEGKRSRRTN